MTDDQVREVNARNAVECELIDEALGRVLAAIEQRGWTDDVDVIFTTDHGELQGDFGLLFKGPYHVDALMRLPLIWRPAPSARVAPAVVTAPVGLVDLAPTFCAIAGIDAAATMQGRALPIDDADADAAVSNACSPSGTASCSASACTCAPSPRRMGVHRLPARATCTTAPRASSTTSPTIRSSSTTAGTIPPSRRCSRISSPTFATTQPTGLEAGANLRVQRPSIAASGLDVDAVEALLPIPLHTEGVEELLCHGWHVNLQKPMCNDVASAAPDDRRRR